jgi:hypothetical protein
MPRVHDRTEARKVSAAYATWLPWPLNRSKWWVRPVRAERLAAFRIGLAAVLLVDVLVTYLPYVDDFFGPEPLAGSAVHTGGMQGWNWSLLRGLNDVGVARGVMLVWALSAATLLLGLWPRASAAVAGLLAISVFNLNPDLHDGGDRVRILGLFYLMLSPCGAVWSIDQWRHGREVPEKAVYVAAWPLRLLFVQMVAIYLGSGIPKMTSSSWRDGSNVHYILENLTWSSWSYAQLPVPYILTRLIGLLVPTWEVGFPLLVLMPRTRTLTLWMGVLFHLSLYVSMRLGLFPLYMLCLYLPLVPWERYSGLSRRLFGLLGR